LADVPVIVGIALRPPFFRKRKNNGVVTAAEFKEKDRSRIRYRTKHDLDPFGQKAETSHCEAGG